MKRTAFLWIAGSLVCAALTTSATTRYVNLNNPAAAPPYTSWPTAATNIQHAIDEAADGDEIVVTNGVYATGGRAVYGAMTNRVAINKAVTVRSVNGPLLTVIEGSAGTTNGDGAIRCVYVGTNAVFSGFTLTNGHTRTDGDWDKEMSGGGAWCEWSGVVSNCTLSGNSAISGGGVSGGTLNNCTLRDNSANWEGGGAYDSTLNDCTLSGNSAGEGGGAYDSTLNDCTLSGNSAAWGGGAYHGTLNNCTLSGNSAGEGGGAHWGTLNNCILSGNSASSYGGGAYYGTLNNCTLSGNSASNSGGGAGLGTLNNCIVYYNWAPNGPNYYGGTFNYSCTTPLPEGAGNFADAPRLMNTNGWSNLRLQSISPCINAGNNLYAPGLTDLDGNPRISRGTVDVGAYESQPVHYVTMTNSNPLAPYNSWATAATNIQHAIDEAADGDEIVVTNGLYATGGRAVYGTMTNRVTMNKAVTVRSVNGPLLTVIEGRAVAGTTNGDGAIRCVYVGTNAVLSGFTLTNGHTRTAGDYDKERQGGGAWCEPSGVVSNCTLSGNSADWCGGGAYGGTLNNCTLSGNSAHGGGGAFVGTLNNCTLSGNSADWCGGGASYGTLNNCTMSGNSASYGGGGVDHGTLNNCIVYYNSARNGPNHSDCTFNYSCTTPLPPGPGNTNAEPLLASTSHLSAQSPCIGAGSSAYSRGVDIDGESWLEPPCMGADQFAGGQATGGLTMAITAAYTKVSTGVGLAFVGEVSGHASASVWDFGDGAVVSNRPYTSHAWAAPGLYEVRLTGYNDIFPGGVSAGVWVRVGAREVYYVNGANAAPVYPYTNWVSAATNIQEAIDAGEQIGRLVLVADGVYGSGGRAVHGQMTNRVVVAEGVEVRSVNGPLLTVIEGRAVAGAGNGDGAIRCVYVGPNAVLSGFTLTNGHTRMDGDWDKEQNGGGVWCESSGVVSNCTLSGNSASYGGGASYGTLNNCTLSGNSAYYDDYTQGDGRGGGASGGTLNNCTLSGNSADFGGGAYYATLNNCTLSGNSSSGNGGGAYDGTLNNCTLSGNSALESGGGACGGTLNNCIVYYNSAPSGPNHYYYCTFNYSCTTPLPAGTGNFTNAPLFVETNGWSNLRLQTNSPCINAGNNLYAPGLTDLDGLLRIAGGTVDIGAYEFQGAGLSEFTGWLWQYGLCIDGSSDYADSDTDGHNNWQEWRCQTDPTNALSALRLLSAVPAGTDVTVTWQSVAGVNYHLLRSTNLWAWPPFALVATNVVGQAGATSYTETNAAHLAPLYYRVGVGE